MPEGSDPGGCLLVLQFTPLIDHALRSPRWPAPALNMKFLITHFSGFVLPATFFQSHSCIFS
ncbi:hypothetical protein BDV59DRAFT_173046 [Aspergillus ambiguus]|uniref:uncharacterized protein n=1 Tax=Aspergillus ambiguus TaxID=176160 RepID=UPI003CCCDD3B